MTRILQLTPEQRQRFAAILHEVHRRAARIRARQAAQLGGCSVAATETMPGCQTDLSDVTATDELPSIVKEQTP
jgi:hypothetical protein